MRRELFSVVRVLVTVNVYGVEDRFDAGVVPQLEAALNAQEVFDSSSRIARRYLSLEGENWDAEIEPREMRFSATGFRDAGDIQKSVAFYLSEARRVLGHCHYWAEEVTVNAWWPLEEKDRRGRKPIGAILNSRTSKITAAHLKCLTGELWGSGISLLGGTDSFAWKLDAGPVGDETLVITAKCMFPAPEPSDWPTTKEDILLIEGHIKSAYEFMDTDVQDFIEVVMPETKG